MVDNLTNRLWNNSEIITAFKIFDPEALAPGIKRDLLAYGNGEIDTLFNFYKVSHDLDHDDLRSEWNSFKVWG